MLDDLVQTIEMLKARIKKHGDHLGPYEKRTRVALIDPLLCALGWDVSDPDFVEIETRTANSWADYALLDSNRKPNVFVEAKKLADRDAPITQTVGYAVSENITHGANVRYCASTNGDVWEVYDITAQKSVMKVSITQDDSAACALKLLGLWRRSLRDNGFNTAVEPLVVIGNEATSGSDAQVQPTPVQSTVQPPHTYRGRVDASQRGSPFHRVHW